MKKEECENCKRHLIIFSKIASECEKPIQRMSAMLYALSEIYQICKKELKK